MSRMPDAPPEAMLFDNVRDPYQLKDLSREDPRTAERLTRDELIPWLERTGDPWLENLAPKQG
jgi:hypothetical protein